MRASNNLGTFVGRRGKYGKGISFAVQSNGADPSQDLIGTLQRRTPFTDVVGM